MVVGILIPNTYFRGLKRNNVHMFTSLPAILKITLKAGLYVNVLPNF